SQRLERKSARAEKMQIVIVPIPRDYTEFCRKTQAMERDDKRKREETQKLEDTKNQSAENERVASIVEPFHYMVNDGYEDKPVESIAQVMLTG
ncbi:hypothetical protein LPJ76_006127, partial [Coemansia sp. RSA 638]